MRAGWVTNMAELSEYELRFLWAQRIDESEVMDCADFSPRRYKWAMEEEGYLFCIAPRPLQRRPPTKPRWSLHPM
jgi:hypothetical protein